MSLPLYFVALRGTTTFCKGKGTMLQLYVKRNKIFISVESGAEQRFITPQLNNPFTAPEWIADTLTFKQGIKDGSIIDLTPKAIVEVKEPVPEDTEGAPDGNLDAPQSDFGKLVEADAQPVGTKGFVKKGK